MSVWKICLCLVLFEICCLFISVFVFHQTFFYPNIFYVTVEMTTKTISTKFRIKLPNRRSSKSGHRQPKCTLNSRRRKHEKPECTESQTNNDNNNNFDYGYQRWIAKVKDYCAKYHLLEMLNDPNRCFSIMDMPFRIPAGKEATDDSSQTATFSLILGGNAAGLMTLPTFVLHEAELYDAIQKEIPANWAIGEHSLLLIWKLLFLIGIIRNFR